MYFSIVFPFALFCSAESWLSAQSYCQSVGGSLPVLRQWEYLYHINVVAQPWPVYIGAREVSVKCIFLIS